MCHFIVAVLYGVCGGVCGALSVLAIKDGVEDKDDAVFTAFFLLVSFLLVVRSLELFFSL